MKVHMLDHVTAQKSAMFQAATEIVESQLEEMYEKV